MKNLKVIFYLLIVFNIICLSSKTDGNLENSIAQEITTNSSYSAFESKDSAFVISRIFSISLCNTTHSNLNKPFENYFKFTFLTILKKSFINGNLKQNNNFIINCLIHYKKSDLIFPFHYYW